MKKYLLSTFCMLTFQFGFAQIDTVIFEDFQFDPFTDMSTDYTGMDDDWVNFDQDGLETVFGPDAPRGWLGGQFFINALDSITGETEYVAISVSFLEGFLPGNRNWLVLPPIEVSDDSYMLHWESSPSQLPRYMDGYEVLISTTGNNVETDFTESLFKAASMSEIIGDSQSTDYINFLFTDGYLHAMGGTDSTYFRPGETLHSGLLEPHSVDLSAYTGQTVYIAFLHNSDDDDRIAIDDILITKAGVSSSQDLDFSQYRIECYPNPIVESINVNYRLQEREEVQIKLYNVNGQLIYSKDIGTQTPGNHTENINLRTQNAGVYTLNLQIGGKVKNIPVVKK